MAFLLKITIGLCNNSGDNTTESVIMVIRFSFFSAETIFLSLDLRRSSGFSSLSIENNSSTSILVRGSSK